MKSRNPLIGKNVMVHPQLTTDPASRQGEIGIVIGTERNNETATVEFKDGSRADYYIDGLLTLYPKEVILQGAVSNPEIGSTNQKLLLKVQKLADKKLYDEALKLAITNDTTIFHCTTSLAHWMEMMEQRKRNIGQAKKYNRNKG